MILAFLVTAVLAAQNPADSSAYLDAEARRLVAAARQRRETIDRSITAYRTRVRERIGVGIRALRRDRMLYRREIALQIDWRRDSLGRITVIGARETIPAAIPKPSLPEDLKSDAPDYAFDPADDRLTMDFGGGGGGGDNARRDSTQGRDSTKHHDVEFRHPLAPGSEADYRFATGDSSVVVFADGRTIKLRELIIIPRRVEFRLMAGSFWIDENSHAVVRALIRPARPFDLEQDVEDNSGEHVPGFLKPIRAAIHFLTIDYGLWNGRWWLPRLIAMDAVATAGSFLQMPLHYERLYDHYEVQGDTAARLAPRPPRASAAEDSLARAACHARAKEKKISCRCSHGHCMTFAVSIPTDTAALLASAALPPPFGAGTADDTLISAGELAELTHGLGDLPQAPWQFHARPPRWGLARYNRIEGLSLGARGELDLGRLQLNGTARIATTNGHPDLQAGVRRETGTARIRVNAYHRLAAVDPTAHSLSIGNSLGALVLGRDDGDYFRASGAELTVAPAVTLPQRFVLRVYAERQRHVTKLTDFSLPHALHADHLFRPNITADSADQLGASLTLHTQRGIDPARPQWTADVTLDGGVGTFRFGRVSSTVRVAAPLGPRIAGAMELAGGMADGVVPIQSYWYLGGPGTVRG
ncbi:MAG TPA: hypothetical protein VKQ05_10405, partial [Gemmatimonadales bacterium]|nr:hypothetical protein [Gemmatimonadales bacterium]